MSFDHHLRGLALAIGVLATATVAGTDAPQEPFVSAQAKLAEADLDLKVVAPTVDTVSVTPESVRIDAAELAPSGFTPLAPEPDLVLLLGLGLLLLGRLAGGRLG
jgi:hypothetical protein